VSRALLFFTHNAEMRSALFRPGLVAAGYEVVERLGNPGLRDVLLIWNREHRSHAEACRFEKAGAKVVVAENGYLGNSWRGAKWFALALNHHNGAGTWPDNGPQRWDSWGVDLAPWCHYSYDSEVVILAQRGIGEEAIKSPSNWSSMAKRVTAGRVREHPGMNTAGVSLDDDLRNAWAVATWSSGAALKALTLGIPVFYGMPNWIGAGAGRLLVEFAQGPKRDDAARLAMFRRLAWAQWSEAEVAEGTAFRALLT